MREALELARKGSAQTSPNPLVGAVLVRDGDHDSALGGSIELGEDDAGDAAGIGELAGLFEAVLAGGGIEHEKDFVGRIGDDLLGRAVHLLEFRHEVLLGLKAAGGIDDDIIGFAGARGVEGVEEHGTRVAALILADDGRGGALAPDSASMTPKASSWPSSMTSGVVTRNPGGAPPISTRIGPSKPSIRCAATLNSLALPAPTVGSAPLTLTLKSGRRGRTVSM